MLDLLFSSLYVALSACSLQKPLLDTTNPKPINQADVLPLDTLATLPATFCPQPIRQAIRMVFRHKLFKASSSCPFKSSFRPPNQSASNVTYVTCVTTKTAFFSHFTSLGGNFAWVTRGDRKTGFLGPNCKKTYTVLSIFCLIMKGPEEFMTDYDGFFACFGPFFKKLHRPLSMFLY